MEISKFKTMKEFLDYLFFQEEVEDILNNHKQLKKKTTRR